ncbi:hypothetical protein SDC9_124672 [bioreactor metagenome]|uniref:Uncharacterized protein n=1 Tax=bioreactor metagenome TaxID=1076179 RepID=A0A645CL48_9ZZZZ
MNLLNSFWLRQGQKVKIALELPGIILKKFPSELLFAKPVFLEHCPHCSVKYEDSLFYYLSYIFHKYKKKPLRLAEDGHFGCFISLYTNTLCSVNLHHMHGHKHSIVG